MLEHAMGTLTFWHRYCAVATLDYKIPFGRVNYIRIVAFSPDSLRDLLYGETISIRYSTTIHSLSLVTQASYSSLRVLFQ